MDLNIGQLNVDQARLQQAKQLADSVGRSALSSASADEKKMRDTANDFEAIFVKQLMDSMEKTVDREDGLFSNSNAESYFRDMMYDDIAHSLSKRPGGSGFGLAESIYRQMSGQSSHASQPIPTDASLKIAKPQNDLTPQ